MSQKRLKETKETKKGYFPPGVCLLRVTKGDNRVSSGNPVSMRVCAIKGDKETGPVSPFSSISNRERERVLCFIYKRLETRMDSGLSEETALSPLSPLIGSHKRGH